MCFRSSPEPFLPTRSRSSRSASSRRCCLTRSPSMRCHLELSSSSFSASSRSCSTLSRSSCAARPRAVPVRDILPRASPPLFVLLEPFLFDALSFELLNSLPFKLLGLDTLSLESQPLLLHPLGAAAACRRCHTVGFQPPPPRLYPPHS